MPDDRTPDIRILQISDLHVGIKKKDDRFILANPEGDGISSHISRALIELQDAKPFDFIVVTGDIIEAKEHDSAKLSTLYEIADSEIRNVMRVSGITDTGKVFIIPGNQDVERLPDEKFNIGGFDNYLNFLKKFYGVEKPTMGFEVETNGEKNNYQLIRPEWCIKTDKQVIFWPIFTASLNEIENRDGRLSDDEFMVGARHLHELREQPAHKNDISIVLAHHNFFPVGPDRMTRQELKESGSDARYGFPENGMEYLEKFFRDKVDVILHGHRHYDFIFSGEWDEHDQTEERNGIVVGCPSTGYYEGESVPASEHGQAGFRVLDIFKSKSRIRTLVKKFKFKKTQQGWKSEKTCRDLNLRSFRGAREFMYFEEGYGKFLSEMLCPMETNSSRTVTIYHYHNDTRWDDSYKRFFALTHCDRHLIHAALMDNWFKHIQRNKFNTLIAKGYLSKILGNDVPISKLDKAIHNALVGEPKISKNDDFEAYLRNMVKAGGEDSRSVAYIGEALLCAAYNSCEIMKHVYICPQYSGEAAPTLLKRNKFRWLCESILLVRELNNYNITWLPFAIRNYNGRSLVGIRTSKAAFSKDVYYVGFDVQPDSKSVFRMPGEAERTASPEGPILADLKAVVSKVVNPLSARLLHDLPLLKDGVLHLSHLQNLAIGIGCFDVWTDECFEEKIRNAFPPDKIVNDIGVNDILLILKELYVWVGKTPDEGPHIPWDEKDMKALKDNLAKK